jgi:Nif-specific regulatory protein
VPCAGSARTHRGRAGSRRAGVRCSPAADVGTATTGTLADRVDLFERDIIVDSLKRTEGNMSAAARDLPATPRILRYKVKHLDIDYSRYRRG